MDNTPTYIKALVTPQAKAANTSRKVWSIDLETVWLPFFTATNTMGDTSVPSGALGAPFRLAYNKDSTVKFSNSSKPVIRVAKDLSDSVRMVRDNFTAGLQAYANGVALENSDGFKAEIMKSHEAGTPIITRDNDMLKDAYAHMIAEQVEAELKAKQHTEPPKDKSKAVPPAKPKVKARKTPVHGVPVQGKPKAPKTPAPPADTTPNHPADIPTNGNHAEPDTEPTHEPVLVS